MFHGVIAAALVAALGHFHDLAGLAISIAIAALAYALRTSGPGGGVIVGVVAVGGALAALKLGEYRVPSGHGMDVKDLAFTGGGIATIVFGALAVVADAAVYAARRRHA
jgi:hypothetical protein